MAYVHLDVNMMSKQYLLNERRYNYTTPKSFLELVCDLIKHRSHKDFNSLPVAYFSKSTSRGGLNPDSYATGNELKSSCERGFRDWTATDLLCLSW